MAEVAEVAEATEATHATHVTHSMTRWEDLGIPQRAINALLKEDIASPDVLGVSDLPWVRGLKGVGPTSMAPIAEYVIERSQEEVDETGNRILEEEEEAEYASWMREALENEDGEQVFEETEEMRSARELQIEETVWKETLELAVIVLPHLLQAGYPLHEVPQKSMALAVAMGHEAARWMRDFDVMEGRWKEASTQEVDSATEQEEMEEDLRAQGFVKDPDGKWRLRPQHTTQREEVTQSQMLVDQMQAAGMVWNSIEKRWVPRPPEQGARLGGAEVDWDDSHLNVDVEREEAAPRRHHAGQRGSKYGPSVVVQVGDRDFYGDE